jgi:hypothetical protein
MSDIGIHQRLANWCHGQVSRAIRIGYLRKLDGTVRCVDCGAPAVGYDHRDYYRPLWVDPVCARCNALRGPAHSLPPEKRPIGMKVIKDKDRVCCEMCVRWGQKNDHGHCNDDGRYDGECRLDGSARDSDDLCGRYEGTGYGEASEPFGRDATGGWRPSTTDYAGEGIS